MADLSAIMKLVRSNPAVLKALPALAARYGSAGVLALARGYLGPVAPRAGGESKAPPPPAAAPATGEHGEQPGGANADGTTTTDNEREGEREAARAAKQQGSGDSAVLGLAVTKLIYELGELALHNPELDPKGKQPEFKLDEQGRPPAMSIAHIIAVARLVQAYRAEEPAPAAPPAPTTNRARLQAARAERYAEIPRYSYLARPVSYRAPR